MIRVTVLIYIFLLAEYLARRQLAASLLQVGSLEEAKIQFAYILSLNPSDFGALFLLRDILSRQLKHENHHGNISVTINNNEAAHTARIINESQKVYSSLQFHAKNEYKGFIAEKIILTSVSGKNNEDKDADKSIDNEGTSWNPYVFTTIPTSSEFTSFVSRREPFLIKSIDFEKSLNWKVVEWFNISYLVAKAGNEKVRYEKKILKSSSGCSTSEADTEAEWGFSAEATHEVDTFEAFLTGITDVRRAETSVTGVAQHVGVYIILEILNKLKIKLSVAFAIFHNCYFG